MPSASSAKSAKASSVPPAEPRPSTATLAKSAAPVTGSPIVTNSNVDPSSIVSSVSNTTTGGVGAGATAATALIAVAPAAGAAAPATVPGLTAENNSSSSLSTPIKQTLIVIEHKIRNLEKRKTKLESYRAIQASGKELSADQKQAVAKYDEVMQCLDFARDLTKQMIQLSNNAEKEQKKLARREAMLRAQAETVKIREVLTIQNILLQFADATVREDFLNGANGAVKLEESDLDNLDKFYCDVNAKRQESPEDVPFLVSAQKAAELLSFTIDGRPKQYGDTTFENLRKVFQSIQECGYFDLAGKAETTEEEELVEVEATEQAQDEENNGNDLNVGATEQEGRMELFTGEVIQLDMTQAQPVVALVDVAKYEAPSAAAVPAPAFPQPAPLLQQQAAVIPATLLGPGQMAPPQSQLPRQVIVPSVVPAAATVVGGLVAQPPPPAGQVPLPGVPPAGAAGQIHAAHFPPTTVRAVEQGYFKQHQYIQQMRPLADVIGSTNFHFLQESELDSPDMVPPGGFTPTDGQTANTVMTATVIPLQSPNAIPQTLIQQQTPQQQQQQQQSVPQQQTSIPLQQPPGMPQQSQAGPPNSGIPSQTFTNQTFPPIVPPQATSIFPGTAIQSTDLSVTQQPPQPQMPPVIFSTPQQPGGPGVIPMQSLVAPPVVVSQQQTPQTQILGGIVDNQAVADVISQQAAANIANLMTGPRVNVSLPGFPPNKFPQQTPNAAMVGVHSTSVSQIPVQDALESLQQQAQQPANDKKQHHDELKENRGVPQQNDTSQDWDAHEPHVQQKSHSQTLAARQDEESNQWSNEVTNSSNSSSKHDWNSNYDNQNDSNTWKNMSNDNYGGRGTSGGRNNYANRTGGVGRGGSGMRGNNAGGGGGPPSNGYRGRSNNYQQQQNNRNTGMYFRNNDSYYQNQNGNSGGYGNKDSSGNYVGGSNSNYRPRGGLVPPNSRQQSGGRLGGPPNNGGGGPGSQGQSGRNNAAGSGGQNPNRSSNMGSAGGGNMSTNPNPRPGRNNPGSAYGNSRPPPPPNNVRQQQDINA